MNALKGHDSLQIQEKPTPLLHQLSSYVRSFRTLVTQAGCLCMSSFVLFHVAKLSFFIALKKANICESVHVVFLSY